MLTIQRCIICNGTKFWHVTKQGRYFSGERVIMCTYCGMVSLSSRMTANKLEAFYSSNQFSEEFRGVHVPNNDIRTSREQRARDKMRLIHKYLQKAPKGSVLEVGCSSGYLVRALSDEGYDAYGIDPSTGFAKYARDRYNLKVVAGMYPGELPKAWGREFAVIIMLHVLEHTDDPVAIVHAVFNMLSDGGLFILEVPDIERATTARKYLHPHYFQKSHLWDFSARTVTTLLQKQGYDVYVCKHYSHQMPDDKNVLIIAGKNNSKLAAQTINIRPKTRFEIWKFYYLLKYKLLLGQLIRSYKRILDNFS